MASPLRANLVIRNGTLIDGTGAPSYRGDVAISGETIVAVGPNLQITGAHEEIDAQGLLVTPGWIDIHTHYDAQATWDPMLSPSTNNGVTTCIMGNCGVGFAPCQKDRREFLVSLMEAVEDIPGTALYEGIKWEWETFPEYLDSLARKQYACDVAAMVGHSAVRTWVMGSRANLSDRPGGPENDPVTTEEIEKMAKVVKEAVAAGAWGFSTSRLLLHRDKSGILTPGCLASKNELLSIGNAMSEAGGGVMELSADFVTYDDLPYHMMDPNKQKDFLMNELDWMVKIAEQHKDKVPITHGVGNMAPLQRFLSKTHDQITAAGGICKFQVQTRPQSVHLSFAAGNHSLMVSRVFREIWKKGKNDMKKLKITLAHPAVRSAIMNDFKEFKPVKAKTLQGWATYENAKGISLPQWYFTLEGVYPWVGTYEPALETDINKMAKAKGVAPLELAYDLLMDTDGSHRGVLWRPLFGYIGNNDNIRQLLETGKALPGFDDAGAHCSILTDACAPTSNLSFWCRDRTTGPKISIERMVQLQTGDAAALFGMDDRGLLLPGKQADINIIDFDKLKVHPPYWANDLPTGAGRWVQYTEGYRATVNRGEVTFENDQPTGRTPGRLVRNPRSVGLLEEPGVEAAKDTEVVPELDLQQHALKASQTQTAGGSAIARQLRDLNEKLQSRL